MCVYLCVCVPLSIDLLVRVHVDDGLMRGGNLSEIGEWISHVLTWWMGVTRPAAELRGRVHQQGGAE